MSRGRRLFFVLFTLFCNVLHSMHYDYNLIRHATACFQNYCSIRLQTYIFEYPRLEGFLRVWLSPCMTHYDILFAGNAPSCFCGGNPSISCLHLMSTDSQNEVEPALKWLGSCYQCFQVLYRRAKCQPEMFLFGELMKKESALLAQQTEERRYTRAAT